MVHILSFPIIYAHTHAHTYTHIHVHTPTHMYTHTHAHTILFGLSSNQTFSRQIAVYQMGVDDHGVMGYANDKRWQSVEQC